MEILLLDGKRKKKNDKFIVNTYKVNLSQEKIYIRDLSFSKRYIFQILEDLNAFPGMGFRLLV